MVDMTETTTITFKDDGGLQYVDAPQYEYEAGATYFVDRTESHHVDGRLRSIHVAYAVITGQDREYVVPEDEWYVDYQVELRDVIGSSITSERLDAEELADYLDDCERIE